jgi:hypothetical protein
VTKVTLDGGQSSSEKIDSRERVDVHRLTNVIEGGRLHIINARVLSKWLERRPPMSYPRPWRGKLARIKAVALSMHWPMASFKSHAHILRSGRSLRLEGCACGMRRVVPAVPSSFETALRAFSGEGLDSVQGFGTGSKPGVIL